MTTDQKVGARVTPSALKPKKPSQLLGLLHFLRVIAYVIALKNLFFVLNLDLDCFCRFFVRCNLRNAWQQEAKDSCKRYCSQGDPYARVKRFA